MKISAPQLIEDGFHKKSCLEGADVQKNCQNQGSARKALYLHIVIAVSCVYRIASFVGRFTPVFVVGRRLFFYPC